MRQKNQGFTLIELLVVIAIIGLLAAVIIVSLTNSRVKARDARRLTDMHQIQTALELFYSACNSYPSSLVSSNSVATCASGVTLGSYLPNIPIPQAGCTTAASGSSPAGSSGAYGYTSGTSTYTIFFCTEGAVTGTLISGGTAHQATQSGLTN